MPTGLNITQEQQQMIAEAYRAGGTKQAIAIRFGFSVPTVSKALVATGVPTERRVRRVSEERRSEIIRRYIGGESRIAIARSLRSSPVTVLAVLIRADVELRPQFERKIGEDQMGVLAESYQNGATIAALAASYGVTIMTVHKVLRGQGVSMRDERGRRREYTEEEIETIRRMANEGRSQLAIARAVRSHQATVSNLMSQHGITPARSGTAKRERHGGWRGGRHVRADGYAAVMLPPGDPYAPMANRKGYVLEHRLVMARALGRNLEPFEEVHHIDEPRDNNDLNNLQLRRGKHGGGGPYQCAECGSLNIISAKIADPKEA